MASLVNDMVDYGLKSCGLAVTILYVISDIFSENLVIYMQSLKTLPTN